MPAPALCEPEPRALPAPSGSDLFEAETLASLRRARRILVLGSSGAGKSTLSRNLSQILALPAIHLDDQFWLPDGSPREESEWRQIVAGLAARDAWIMDGTYERTLDLRIPRADAIVLLECPTELCLERVLGRESKVPSPQWTQRAGESPARVDPNHVEYVAQYASVTRPLVLEHLERARPEKTVVVVHAPEAVEPFVSALRNASV